MCFKRHHSVLNVFLASPRGRIRHAVFFCSSHRDTYLNFTISYRLNSVRSVSFVLVYIYICIYIYIYISRIYIYIKSFVRKTSYLLPRAKLLLVSLYMKRSFTFFPAKILDCHISRTRHTRNPAFALNFYLVTPIIYIKNQAISTTGTYLAPVCAVWPDCGRAGKKLTAVTLFRWSTMGWFFAEGQRSIMAKM